LLEAGYDIPTVQELLRHRTVSTKMVSTYVLNRGDDGYEAPRNVEMARHLPKIEASQVRDISMGVGSSSAWK